MAVEIWTRWWALQVNYSVRPDPQELQIFAIRYGVYDLVCAGQSPYIIWL
jgi:hypothetical protein